MSSGLLRLDRLVGLVLGLLLVAAGLLLVDWHLDQVLALPERVDLSGLASATDAGWWPFAALAVAIVLLLLGLRWLVAHLPRVRSASTRLPDTSGAGRIELDTGSLAKAVAGSVQSPLALPSASGQARTHGGRATVEVAAHVSRSTEVREVREVGERAARQVAEAFPSGGVRFRLVVDAPRRTASVKRLAKPQTARVP